MMVRWSGECHVNVRECQAKFKISKSRLGKGLSSEGQGK